MWIGSSSFKKKINPNFDISKSFARCFKCESEPGSLDFQTCNSGFDNFGPNLKIEPPIPCAN